MPDSWLVPSLAAWFLLKAVVARYEQSQRRVEQQRQMVQLAQRLHRGLSNLPVELMSEIFCFATIPSWPYDWEDTVPSIWNRGGDTQPFNLLRVCRRWRQIALTTPELWATFNPRFPQFAAVTDVLRVSEEWLRRACKHPLSVNLQGFRCGLLVYDPIIQLIHRHAPRIRALRLCDVGTEDLEALNRHGTVEFSSLERLDLGGEFFTGRLEIFGRTPLLREVQLDSYICLDQVDLPWAQIASFTSQGVTGEETLAMLAKTNAGTRCSLRPTIHDARRDETGPLTHQSIQHLTLIEGSWELDNLEDDEDPADFEWPTHGHILQFLTMPKLQSLELIGPTLPHSAILWEFFERSHAPLRKLSLQHEDGGCVDLPSMEPFVLLNELEELEMSKPSRSFLERFSQMFSSSARILPRLQTVIVDCGCGAVRTRRTPSGRCRGLRPNSL
ncbi:F-box domain-containing protein [Mycena chlorophos]|uniref:F-box domain-containing protein n=1 Tax=Mycena chlorophos TaxID=658473 RepID=A0A8H6VW94_MYCCL|nr:F-box domain-containing protein [Mycena chlorophos]